MARILLVSLLCIAVALLGVFGVHAHLPGDHHDSHGGSAAAGAHEHPAAYVVAVADADHSADHDDDGDIDIDPIVKAFGKLLLLATLLFVSLSILCGFLNLPSRGIFLRLAFAPPLRPPTHRGRFYILPPSHAPPAPLH